VSKFWLSRAFDPSPNSAPRQRVCSWRDRWSSGPAPGILLREAGEISEAEREYREAERVNPNNAQALMEMAKVLWEKGDLEGALTRLNFQSAFWGSTGGDTREAVVGKPVHFPTSAGRKRRIARRAHRRPKTTSDRHCAGSGTMIVTVLLQTRADDDLVG
jgi:hypothetical protein